MPSNHCVSERLLKEMLNNPNNTLTDSEKFEAIKLLQPFDLLREKKKLIKRAARDKAKARKYRETHGPKKRTDVEYTL